MGMISDKEERELLKQKLEGDRLSEIEWVCQKGELLQMHRDAMEVHIHNELIDYICKICEATRNRGDIIAGVSPRGTIAFMKAAQSLAYVKDRNYVIPEDIKTLAVPVLAHRLVLAEGFAGRKVYEDKIRAILEDITVPTEDWSK